jgi:Uma2 family endonuclease
MEVATKLKRWTLEEVHSLPDDGNKYELVRGSLFVTPPPTDDHETILARLSDALSAYVRTHGIGLVYHPRAVLRFRGSETEPDLMVRPPSPRRRTSWEKVPRPILVVEVHSDTTRRRDRIQKKQFYAEAGVAQYWMIDPEQRVVPVARPGRTDRVVSDVLTWNPPGTNAPFSISLDELFGVVGAGHFADCSSSAARRRAR